MKWIDKILGKTEVVQPMQVPAGWLPGMTRPYVNEVASDCAICEESSTRNMDGHALCQGHLGFALGARDFWIKDFNKRDEPFPGSLSDHVVKQMREDYKAGKIN